MRALEARGHTAETVDLPNDEPTFRAQDYAEFVCAHVGSVREPIVLAHSGSGPLLPAAARELGARLQVWLAAWVPAPTVSFREDVAANIPLAFDPGWVGQDPVGNPDVARRFLFHDCDESAFEWAMTTQREFVPSGVYDERIELLAVVPSAYVVATHDRTIRPDWQRRMARERLKIEPIEIESGHCPNVSRPEELADLLGALAQPPP